MLPIKFVSLIASFLFFAIFVAPQSLQAQETKVLRLADGSKIEATEVTVVGDTLQVNTTYGKLKLSKERLSAEARNKYFSAPPQEKPKISSTNNSTTAVLTSELKPAPASSKPSHSQNPTGLAVLVQPVDTARALSLAKAGWMVEALADEAGYKTLRKAAEAEGVLGRNLWVERWNGTIPLADTMADLVEGPTSIAAEAKRVLVPGSGVAKVGDETLRVPRPSTWDDWSHWMHGPDNNRVSTDTAFTLPARVSWLGLPLGVDWGGLGLVAANGRVFRAIGANQDSAFKGNELTAQSLHNGTILWHRKLPAGSFTGRCSMVALDDDLLLLEGGSVLRLNGATGEETGRFDIAPGRALKWMGDSNGALVVLAGNPDGPSKGPEHDYPADRQVDIAEGRFGAGDELICVDVVSGAVRWRVKSPTPIDLRAVAIADGKVIYHAPRNRIAAIDLATGVEKWAQTDVKLLDLVGGERKKNNSELNIVRPGVVAAGKVVLLGLQDVNNFAALSLADGSLLWQSKQRSGRAIHALVLGDQVLDTGLEAGAIVDALTGKKPENARNINVGGCGPFTVANNLVFGSASGPTMDLASSNKEALPTWPLKTECVIGCFVADGRAVYLPRACSCATVKGCVALVSDMVHLPDAKDPSRLEKGKVGIDTVVAPVAGDWPTHRGDVRRSGSSPVAVTTLKQLWEAKPDHPFPIVTCAYPDVAEWRCSPPASLGDLVVVAASDGSVRAFHGGTGVPLWTYWCEGAVLATPTIANGLVYVGSADGCIVCLSASDGALRWRFRAAPDVLRLPVYGLLQSVWPINSGVLVENGVAYAVAGRPLSPPTTVYALDATTGAPRWAKRGEWNPVGGLAFIEKRLWASGFGKPPMRFDPASGESDPDAFNVGSPIGREVAEVAPGLVMCGSGEVYRNVDNKKCGRGEGSTMLHLNAEGRPILPGMKVMHATLVAPAGDDDLVVVAGSRIDTGWGFMNLEGWDTAKSIAETDQLSNIDLKPLPGWKLGQLPSLPPERHKNPTQLRWGPLPLMVRGIALAKNAVVALAVNCVNGTEKESGPWKVMILDRNTGETKQELELPGEPATDGLCLTRTGGVVVALRNGGVIGFGP